VEVVASAEQALALARKRPKRQVVFLGVGFETTAPGTALAVLAAKREGLANFTVLTAHKLILPVMEALLAAGDVQVDGFLCPGHVSVIIGYRAYETIARTYRRPCVVAGFDPPQILSGLAAILEQLVEDAPRACTVYPVVSAEGNAAALKLLEDVFIPTDAAWRAIGVPAAAAATSSAADASRRTAASSPADVRPAAPSGRAWCPPRAPARRRSNTAVLGARTRLVLAGADEQV